MLDINKIEEAIELFKIELKEISDFIHQNPELGLEEFQAAEKSAAFLEKQGFAVQRGIAGLQTAFRAEKVIGSGEGPHFAFMAEYDALPGLGHACGHNLICVSGLAAGCLAVKFLEE